MRRGASVGIGVLMALALVAVSAVHAQDAIRTGEITTIDQAARSFTVRTSRGETPIVTTDTTVVKDGDKVITFADLKVGDQVRVTGVRKDVSVEAREVVRQGH